MASNLPSHRVGEAVIKVEKYAPVSVRQVKTDILFGCAAFESVPLINSELEGIKKERAEKRLQKIQDIFNFVTLPFYWGRFEPEQGKPDTVRLKKAAKWWKERGYATKGHPLCWHTVTAPWLLKMSDEEILKTQLDRITRDVTDFKGLINMWDVINEVVIMPIFDKYDNGITRICKRVGQVGLVKMVFDQTREANPNAALLINDFDMSEDYADLIDELLDAGIKIDAIGLQSHMHQGYWGAEKTAQVLERFSRFKLPLHFTEINMVSGELMPADIVDLNDHIASEWPTTPEGEQRQAEQAAEFYRLLYAHPLVEAVTYWDFTDGAWLNSPAGWMTQDARVKPVYDALYDLIKKQWTTPAQNLVGDENGFVTVQGTKGDYVAEVGGKEIVFKIG